jgi:hypothetical protein
LYTLSRHDCLPFCMLADVVEFCNVLSVNGRFIGRLELRPPYPHTAMLLVVT